MVEIVPDAFEVYIVPLSDFLSYRRDSSRDLLRQESFSVFNGKNKVVVSVIDIVESTVEGHAPILYRLFLTYYSPQ